jgi:hypothetical protein
MLQRSKIVLLTLLALVMMVTGARAQYVFVIPQNDGGQVRAALSLEELESCAYNSDVEMLWDVTPGTTVYFDFRPLTGYHFTEIRCVGGLSVDDISVNTDGVYSFVMPDGVSSLSIQVFFEETYIPPTGTDINAENFPDTNFRSWLLAQDYGKDAVITDEEMAKITKIVARGCGIQDLTGIQFFTKLIELDVSNSAEQHPVEDWNRIASIDLSANTKLQTLAFDNNQLTTIDLTPCLDLIKVQIGGNHLTDLDVSANEFLSLLYCEDNQLTTLDLSHNQDLGVLGCMRNQLTMLNVSSNTKLEQLYCENNQITSLNVSNHHKLMILNCNDNQLTLLNVTGCEALYQLYCYNNRIKGEAMDALVNSLPDFSYAYCVVLDLESDTEQNEITEDQIAVAKAKGWSVEGKRGDKYVKLGANNGYDYVDLGLPSGTLWATCNVGANRATDAGDFFAWGDTQGQGNNPSDGYQFSWENYKWCEVSGEETSFTKYCADSSRGKDGYWDGKYELDPEDDAAYVNWGAPWRMPSKAQFEELRSLCSWTETTVGEVNGYEVKGPSGKSIFLPETGWRIDDVLNPGGAYWTRTSDPDDIAGAYFLAWDAQGWHEFGGRLDGQCVRPVTTKDYISPLTFEAVEAGIINIVNPNGLTIEYSTDGTNWTSSNNNPISINVSANDAVQFRGNNSCYWGSGDSGETPTRFTATGQCYVYGNVMSLVHASDFATNTTLNDEFALAYLFTVPSNDFYSFYENNTTILSHVDRELVLPATSVPSSGYMYMFSGCQAMMRAPQLPATTIGEGSYHQLFADCAGMVTGPEILPATTLSMYCYDNMFFGCSSLTEAPVLSATTLSDGCYMGMFTNCISLVEAPELHAMTLTEDCYHRMFEGCASLMKAPDLPAPTLFGQVYGGMFDGCTSLNYVRCLATDLGENVGVYSSVAEWLNNVAETGTFVKAVGMEDWPVGAIDGIPEGWVVIDDMASVPLTFEAIDAGTISAKVDQYTTLEGITIQYKKNNDDWTDVTWNEDIDVDAGDIVLFQGNNTSCANEYGMGFSFVCSNDCYVYGNVMSLLSSAGFPTATTLTDDYAFSCLFSYEWEPNTTIKNHPVKDIVLPATTLSDYCYNSMFYGCEGLTRAPQLPATMMKEYCYNDMFSACTGLTVAPELPAKTLAMGCYTFMFEGCTGLTSAPVLPATTLEEMCYDGIFMNCTALANAPELPATTLVDGCYSEMFMSCESLETAPVLPAKTLADYCYNMMFDGCTSLNSVTCLATDISADGCTNGWLTNVAAEGTFVRAAGMVTDWSIDDSGIPEGWLNGYRVTIPSSGVGTFSAAENVTIPEGLTASYCTTYNSIASTITVANVSGDAILAATGVLIKGTAGESYTLYETTDEAVTVTGNALVAVTVPTHIAATDGDHTYFMLKSGEFICIEDEDSSVKMPANKAYLQIPTDVLTGSQAISLVWDGGTTGIGLNPNPSSTDEDSYYTLDGRRVEHPAHGFFIHRTNKGSKKVYIK